MKRFLFLLATVTGLVPTSIQRINAQIMEKELPKQTSAFPVGDQLPEMFSQYFIGQAYRAPLTQNKALNCPISNITFEPGCRNNWHSHTGGQILVAVGGKGYYQARGEKARILLPGDVVEIPANVEHWHGAAPDCWFSHLAIECNPQTNRNTWLEPVDDKQYAEATADSIVCHLSDTARHHYEQLFAYNQVNTYVENAVNPRFTATASGDVGSANAINFHSTDTESMHATHADGSHSSAPASESANFTNTKNAAIVSEDICSTDPELAEIFYNFALDEVLQYGQMDMKTRMMITLASHIATQAQTEYRMILEGALRTGVTPVEIKEILYHAVPYAGMAKVADFIRITNEMLQQRNLSLPLEKQSVTTPQTRFEKGLALQKSIFGERIEKAHASAPENQKHIQHYLSANCFGDYQTRPCLDAKTRELLTFSILISLGGCESQVKGHIQGNIKVGNNKDTLLTAVTQLLPYIGYPRSLNAIACLNEVIPE